MLMYPLTMYHRIISCFFLYLNEKDSGDSLDLDGHWPSFKNSPMTAWRTVAKNTSFVLKRVSNDQVTFFCST